MHQTGKIKSAATRGAGGSWLGSAPQAGAFSGFQYRTPPEDPTNPMQREAADKIGGLLWPEIVGDGQGDTDPEDEPDQSGAG